MIFRKSNTQISFHIKYIYIIINDLEFEVNFRGTSTIWKAFKNLNYMISHIRSATYADDTEYLFTTSLSRTL